MEMQTQKETTLLLYVCFESLENVLVLERYREYSIYHTIKALNKPQMQNWGGVDFSVLLLVQFIHNNTAL